MVYLLKELPCLTCLLPHLVEDNLVYSRLSDRAVDRKKSKAKEESRKSKSALPHRRSVSHRDFLEISLFPQFESVEQAKKPNRFLSSSSFFLTQRAKLREHKTRKEAPILTLPGMEKISVEPLVPTNTLAPLASSKLNTREKKDNMTPRLSKSDYPTHSKGKRHLNFV